MTMVNGARGDNHEHSRQGRGYIRRGMPSDNGQRWLFKVYDGLTEMIVEGRGWPERECDGLRWASRGTAN